MLTPDQVAAYLVAAVGAIMGVFERYKSSQQSKAITADVDLVADAKRLKDRAELLGKLADDNQALFTKEQSSHEATRLYWHTKASEFQAALSGCQDRLAEQEARPDYRQMIALLTKQGEQMQIQTELLRETLLQFKRTS